MCKNACELSLGHNLGKSSFAQARGFRPQRTFIPFALALTCRDFNLLSALTWRDFNLLSFDLVGFQPPFL
jgi:hypothetical protein